jgi:hypothetical protein
MSVAQRAVSYLRLYTNFFLPTMKLKSKQRVGSRVKKKYDQALTPYQRVLQSKLVSKAKKERCGPNMRHLIPLL